MPRTYEPIATTTLTALTATVTFSSIPSTYTDLILVSNAAAASGYLIIRVNGDTGTNYSRTNLYGTGSAVASNRGTSQTFLLAPDAGTSVPYMSITQIMNYSNTTTHKTAIQRTANMTGNIYATVGLWRNTAAITSISVGTDDSSNMSVGNTFTLYGIKAA